MDPADLSPFLDASSRLEASSSLASSSEEASPNSTFSEKDLALSGEAHRAFAEGNFTEAAAVLSALRQERTEDPIVRLNLAVAKFRSQSAGGVKGLSDVKEELEAIYQQVADGSDFEEADHGVLIYNLAAVYFLRRQFLKAHQLLVRLHNPSSSSSTSSGHQGEDLYRSLLSLLTTLALTLNLPSAALGYIAEQEKKLPPISYRSPELILHRAQAMVLLKQHKNFKRDLKSNNSFSAKETIAFEFYRANLEYLRGNHRKAQKLLSLSIQNGKTDKPQQSNKQQVCPNTSSFFQNNCGCINMMLNKPSLAAYYFKQALQSHSDVIKAPSMTGKMDFVLQIRKCEMLYNLGLSLLHSGNAEKGFQVLLQAQPMLYGNPHYWLHLAECCIVACTRKYENIRDLQKVENPSNAKAKQQLQREPIAVSFKCVGQGGNQKIIMYNLHDQQHRARNDSGFSDQTTTTSAPTLSLHFASSCLVNAAALIGWRGQAPNGPCQNLPCSSKITSVKAAILINQSFVALCLDNHTQALKHSQELLSLAGNVPAGYLALARLYAGEALIFLDRISEAISVLDPKLVSDVSFSEGAARDEENNAPPPTTLKKGSSNSSSSSLQSLELPATRALFSYNLIIAYLMRGELDKADEMIDFLWANRHAHRIGTKVFSAKLYVQLKRGNVKSCRDLVRQNCAVVSSPPSRDKREQ